MRGFLFIAAITALVSGCSPNNPKRGPVKDKNVVQTLDQGTLEVTADTKVDILFVVDDSRSMRPHQENLSRNIKQFSQEFEKNALIDFHIGITTAWDSRLMPDDPTAAIKKHQGRIIDMTPLGQLVHLKDPESGAAIEGPRYISRETPNFVKVLEKTLLVGAKPGPDDKTATTIGPFTEEFFKPTFRVFEDRDKTNSGFYRQDAYLVIFYITDANDESVADDDQGVDEASLFSYLVHNLKRGDFSKVQAYAALAPSGTSCKPEGSGPPIHIEKFLDRFKNRERRVLNLCSRNYGAKLAAFARDITESIPEKVIDLPFTPGFLILEKPVIKVYYGNQLLRNGQPEYPDDKRREHYTYFPGTQPKTEDGKLQPATPERIVLRKWTDVEYQKDAKIRIELVEARPENLKNGRTRVR